MSKPLLLDLFCGQGGASAGVYGGGQQARSGKRGGTTVSASERRDIMQMPWATMGGASQAIPPAYAKWVGDQLFASLASDFATI